MLQDMKLVLAPASAEGRPQIENQTMEGRESHVLGEWKQAGHYSAPNENLDISDQKSKLIVPYISIVSHYWKAA